MSRNHVKLYFMQLVMCHLRKGNPSPLYCFPLSAPLLLLQRHALTSPSLSLSLIQNVNMRFIFIRVTRLNLQLYLIYVLCRLNVMKNWHTSPKHYSHICPIQLLFIVISQKNLIIFF